MRWRIPVIVVLAVFVAVSCQDATVEPQTTLDDPLFRAQPVHQSGVVTGEFDVFIPCGGVNENAHVVYEGKWRSLENVDAHGGVHFRTTSVFQAYAIGEFGSEWVINQTWPNTFYIPPGEASERVYNEHITAVWIGKAHAPSWNDWWHWKWTMNANGEIKVDIDSHRVVC